MRPNLASLMFGVSLLASSCSNGSFGEFEVSDVQAHHACLNTMFPFEPFFLAARGRAESVGLFMQADGGAYTKTDLIYIEVFDSSFRSHTLDAPGDIFASAIAEVEMGGTCPKVRESLYIRGTVDFDSFGQRAGDIIEGRLEGEIWSRRTETLVAGRIEGAFRIEVAKGQPYEEFY